MLLPGIAWPLDANMIRKNSVANTFGMVRNGGQRAHQGWDLLAYPGTRCYAVADGVVTTGFNGDYGRFISLEFEHRGRTLFAFYAHLNMVVVTGEQRVAAGEWIGLTGNTGNASTMRDDDQHLHFEIRTEKRPGHGLGGRIDPKTLYGFVPLKSPIYDTRPPEHLQTAGRSGTGLKVSEINVL